MPRAKTQTKAKKPTTAELIEKAVQEQLMEALQNIEISLPEQDAFVDMDLLREEIKKEVELAQKTTEHQKEVEEKRSAEVSVLRSEITLAGSKDYKMYADDSGLLIDAENNNLMAFNNSGGVGFGIKSPRSSGKGSGHFRAWYPSEAPLPTSGNGSTRGLIVEGDGDDNKTFVFRAVSRKNRQGFNVTSDGSLVMGYNTPDDMSKISLVQNEYDEPGIKIDAKSKQYQSDALLIKTSTSPNKTFNMISAHSDDTNVFKVDGRGFVHTEHGLVSNRTGYAEIFEWEDGNAREEDRTGITVTLNELGQIRIAGEGDDVIGVIGKSAAVIGNAGWNAWQHRYRKADSGEPVTQVQKIVEWEDEVGVLHSHYLESLSDNFAIPENATIYETDGDGSEFEIMQTNAAFNKDQSYTQRLDRGWALVIITGRVNVFKGQLMNPSWFKIKDLNDELEEWFLK